MSTRPDATAQAELDQSINEPGYCAFLDLVGDPLRVTTAPYSMTFAGTGDAQLDGHTFDAQDGLLMRVSPVEMKEGGGSTVTATLSGLIGIDTDTLNIIGDKSKWQGREAVLWAMMIDPDGDRVGNIWTFYRGYMTVPKIVGDRDGQTIIMTIESWLNFMSQPSGRTWLSQKRYDDGDASAEASIAIANGTKGNALVNGGAMDPFLFARGGGLGPLGRVF